ncbi:MAG: hypothetical protein IPL62_14940 [Caulobacteraceae bacterium]|nr:hypothetical protein [Caulobacteraceae bacterium]
MTDSAWVLKGIDPETRDRAVQEAGRLGVSLSDYLTDMVLRAAITDQVVTVQPEEPAAPQDGAESSTRHRFRTLERRLEHSLGSLDAAQRTLDASFFDISERFDELEGLANGTAHALQQGLQDTAEQLIALQQQAEDSAAARASENAAAHEGLASSISALGAYAQDIDTIARRADTNAGVLADAHETLKHAVASDFAELSDQIALRLNIGLRDVAAAADEAASQTDAAVASLVNELRDAREALEQSVADGVDETRRRVHTAFTDAAKRMEALSDRVDLVERQGAVSADQIRARMADMEDASQIALEETAETLRQAGAALAADMQRAAQDQRAALESVHSDLTAEIADIQDRQQGALARLKLLDAAVSHGVTDLNTLRQEMLERVASAESIAAERSGQVLSIATEQTDAVAARLTRHEAQTAEATFTLRANTDRIEASTFAALEKLAGDIAASKNETAQIVEQARARTEAETAEIREQHSGFGARLTIIDLALRTQTSLIERIGKVEAALSDAASGAKLSDMEAQVNVLRQAIGRNGDEVLVRRIEDLSARLSDAAHGDAALDSKLVDVEAQMNVLRQAIARSGDDGLLRRIEELRGGGVAVEARLGDIEAQVNVLRQAVARSGEDHILQRLSELTARVDGWDNETQAGAEKSESLVRLMGRLSTNYAEASAQADQRLHKLEVALADLRLEQLSAREAPVASTEDVASLSNRISAVERLHAAVLTPDDVASLESRMGAVERLQRSSISSESISALESRLGAVERLQASGTPELIISGPSPEEVANLNRRLAAMEARQADALETLRGDITRFVSDNDRRLGAIEHTEADYNLAAEFDALRRRVEERILGIEQRSVRTLEQVADSVQMLEERFMGRDDGERQTA